MSIEFVQGQESHTSNYGKYYVKGLEEWQVKEDHEELNKKDKHHSYQCYVALDVPIGTIFTIFEQSGNKYGINEYFFSICEIVEKSHKATDRAVHGNGFIEGSWRVLASGKGRTKAPRLMNWWIDSPNKSKEFALHCAAYIDKRGIKNPPSI